jgi:hypothetical protein
MRLEQRMGRIHRYQQEKDCLIFNFVSTNTREGRVLHKLFERLEAIEADLDPKHTGKVFNVLGEVFPANQLEKMVRDMYAKNLTEEVIKSRIVEQVDAKRFKEITNSTLEGLAKKELNLSSIVGKSAEAKERRLVPEVIEGFFLKAAPLSGLNPKEASGSAHVYRLGKIPRVLWPIGERLEPRFGRLGREYRQIVFDKELLSKDPLNEWVTPGHPLFESVREQVAERVEEDLQRGTVFYDLQRSSPSCMDVFSACIRDGRGNILHKRLFVVETTADGKMYARQPTIFLDLVAPEDVGAITDGLQLPSRENVEQELVEQALSPFLQEITEERQKQVETISRHVEISLNELINRQNLRLAELLQKQQSGESSPLLAANTKQTENWLDELNARLERRREELKQEQHCTISEITHHGRAWVLPHPERTSPDVAPMVRDDEIEKIAILEAIRYEEQRGWQVHSVEKENRGFDLISRRLHAEDPQTAIEVRFIEVKGRAGVGEIALTTNEYKTAERLKKDFWLYVVYNCGNKPQLHLVQDPVRLDWKPLVKIELYHVAPNAIIASKTPSEKAI